MTFQMYSGRPNPSMTVTDPAQVRAIEDRLARSRVGLLTSVRAPYAVLGYTGVKVERLGVGTPDGEVFIVRRDELRVEDGAGKSVAGESNVTVSPVARELEDFLLTLGQKQGVLDDVGLSFIRSSK